MRSATILRRYAAALSDAKTAPAMGLLLAREAPQHVGAAAATVIVEEEPGRLVVRVPPPGPWLREGTALETDVVGDELAGEVLRAAGEGFERAQTVPLLSGRSLVGALVILWQTDAVPDDDGVALVETMAEITAMAIENQQQLEALRRSYDELRTSREALLRSEKLRALGQMAAGIAHDLKNILNPISLHLQFLKRAVPADMTDAQDSVEQMRDAVKRGVQTIDRLREFARLEPSGDTGLVELDRVATEAVALVRPRLAGRASQGKRAIDIVTELGSPPPIPGHAAELVGAVVNLVVNAIDAMPEGGKITLHTGQREAEAFIEVADTGPGIPPDIASKVFDPFFTTKGEEGTGLGLAMVDVTARRHGGHPTLDTEVGRGTRITLWLPRALG